MHYNVIVTAEIKQDLADPTSQSVERRLLTAIFGSKTKIISEGTLSSSRDGRINLSFKSENGRKDLISFSKAEPELIALCRGDNVFHNPVTLFLEEGKRHRCVCKGKNGEHIEFTVKTFKVDNRLLKSGKLNLDYSIDVCGVRVETSQMTITVVHDTSEK